MKIGKGYERSKMNFVQVDFSRNIELTGNLRIPTKGSILRDTSKKYYVSHTPDGEGCVMLYRYDDYYVKWKGKMYHVDSPEKYDILVNIISTDFALARL